MMFDRPLGPWTPEDSAALDKLIRRQKPPRVTQPALIRDERGRVLATVTRQQRREPGPWDRNGDAR